MTFPDDDNSLAGGEPTPGQPNEKQAFHSEQDENNPEEQIKKNGKSFPLTEEISSDFDYSRMEDDVAAFRRELDAIKLPSAEDAPELEIINKTDKTPRRRRRTARSNENTGSPDSRLEILIQLAYANFDFFIFSLLCGVVLGIGYLLDSQAILITGILVAPLLGPWMGAALATSMGEIRLLKHTFGGIFSSLFLVFLTGIIAGFILRFILNYWQPLTSSQAFVHARLWWPDLLVLVLGTVIMIAGFIKDSDKPMLSSIMVSYEIFLPISAAGFGLGSGIPGLWPQAGLVGIIHLAISLLIGSTLFLYMGYRPLDSKGYTIVASSILIILVVLAFFSGIGRLINIRGEEIYATAIPTSSPQEEPTKTPTSQPAILKPAPVGSSTTRPTASSVPSMTRAVATSTPNNSPTPTLTPTPVFGRIKSIVSNGITVRLTPGGPGYTTARNDYLVKILGDAPVVVDGITWLHVIILAPFREVDGWIQFTVVQTVTPSISP